MIKTIIKRDGTKQEFSASKLNGWGIWASENLGHYVSWPDVVLSTVSTLPEKCTSLELQNRGLELLREKQALRTKDDKIVKEIRDVYSPLVRSYYKDPKAFKLTKQFIETKTSYAN